MTLKLVYNLKDSIFNYIRLSKLIDTVNLKELNTL